MGPLMQQLQALPARSRQGLNNLRQRIFQQGMFFPFCFRPSHLPWSSYLDILTLPKGERQPKEANLLRTSLSAHRPVWITAAGGLYTSMAAVYLTMRYLKRVAR